MAKKQHWNANDRLTVPEVRALLAFVHKHAKRLAVTNELGDRMMRGTLYTLFSTDSGLDVFSYGPTPALKDVKTTIQTGISFAITCDKENYEVVQEDNVITMYVWLVGNIADSNLADWRFVPRSIRQGVLTGYTGTARPSEMSENLLTRGLLKVQRAVSLKMTSSMLEPINRARAIWTLNHANNQLFGIVDDDMAGNVFRTLTYPLDSLQGCLVTHNQFSQIKFAALYLYTLITCQRDDKGERLVRTSNDLKRVNPHLHTLFYTVLDLAQARGQEIAGLPRRGLDEVYCFGETVVGATESKVNKQKITYEPLPGEVDPMTASWVTPVSELEYHICCHRQYFDDFTPLNVKAGSRVFYAHEQELVRTRCHILGIGTVVVKVKDDLTGKLVDIVLRDCLYIPEAHCNIISLATLSGRCEIDDGLIEIQFDKGTEPTIPPQEHLVLRSMKKDRWTYYLFDHSRSADYAYERDHLYPAALASWIRLGEVP
jgi:hypothetical protein